METKSLIRALVFGAVVAVGGIGLFLLMYLVVLTELAPLLRLLGAFFTPIVAITILVGIMFLFKNRE